MPEGMIENGIQLLFIYRRNPPEVFLGKGALKICSKFIGEYTCLSAISTKLQSNFINVTLWQKCSPVNLLHISKHFFLRTPLAGCYCIS